MATRKSRTSRNSTRETTSRTTQGVDQARFQHAATESSQQHFALAADAATMLLRTAEIYSQVQLQAVQRSSRTWQQAAERLRAATTPMDFIGAQNQLAMDSMLQFVQFTQDLVQATAAARPAAAELAEEEQNAAEATVQAAMQTPMVQAWQAMLNPLGLGGAAVLNGAMSRTTH